MPRAPEQPMLPLPVPARARRPHASNLTAAERSEFERLDIARHHRQIRKGRA